MPKSQSSQWGSFPSGQEKHSTSLPPLKAGVLPGCFWGGGFLLLENHWKVLAKHVDSWISFSKQSESGSLRTEFRGLGCLGDFNRIPVRTLKMYS